MLCRNTPDVSCILYMASRSQTSPKSAAKFPTPSNARFTIRDHVIWNRMTPVDCTKNFNDVFTAVDLTQIDEEVARVMRCKVERGIRASIVDMVV